jgi:hypothetical protein
MGVFDDFDIDTVNHYAPLHYLPFIARAGSLLGKPSLANAGFPPSHLRSMSCQQDVSRGFGEYAFLTLDSKARILKAKLHAGFPHIGVRVPASAFEDCEFSLCRYNVAMTRFLRRGGKTGFPESDSSGRYYGNKQIPIAITDSDKRSLLEAHLGSGTMIEVLVSGDVILPDATSIITFAAEDAQIAQATLAQLNRPWEVVIEVPPGPYNRSNEYAGSVVEFVDRALSDSSWRGNGLEFDRV